MSLKIITDSACDLPKSIIREFNLEVLDLPVVLDGVMHENPSSTLLDSKAFYAEIRAGSKTSTSQVSLGVFMECFEKHAKNCDSVLYLCFSTGLSGTFSSSCIAAQKIKEAHPDFDISMIDTKNASMGQGLTVYNALVMQRDGASKEEIVKATINHSSRMEHVFTVDDLDYLYRGGRLSKTSALIGGVLGIKPILQLAEDGSIKPCEKVRSKKALISRLVEIASERCSNIGEQLISIAHADNMDTVNDLKDGLTKKYGCKDYIISDLSAVIGSHSGPGTVALFFLGDKEKREIEELVVQ